MGEEFLQDEAKREAPHSQSSSHSTIEQREVDKKLLEIFENRLHALGAAQNRASMFLLTLCIVVFMLAAVVAGLGFWMSATHAHMQSVVEKQEATMLASLSKIDAELSSVATESKDCAERVRKHVWELKTALGLKFSQERGKKENGAE